MENEYTFVKDLKENLYGNYAQECQLNLAHLILIENYGFKTEFCLEPYLLNVNSVSYINCIARLRLSSHNLNIELGRHAKPKLPVC